MRVDTRSALSAGDLAAVARLLDRARQHDGRSPLSERKWIDMVEAGPEGLVSVLVRDTDGGPLVGAAQVSGHPSSWGVELVIDPDHRERADVIGEPLLAAAIDAVARAGGGLLSLWVTDAGPRDDRLAAAHGLASKRELYQLRRPLPVDEPFELTTRTFVPGQDDGAWLSANNRAFAGHPEQGDWTTATLAARMREPWFDARGFLLHEREGGIAGFCWTKIHTDHSPPLGEIYVIGVDPDFQGAHIGRPLVLAGLASLASRGAGVAMLYVDATNTAAMRLYERLGFTVDHIDRAYVGEVAAAGG